MNVFLEVAQQTMKKPNISFTSFIVNFIVIRVGHLFFLLFKLILHFESQTVLTFTNHCMPRITLNVCVCKERCQRKVFLLLLSAEKSDINWITWINESVSHSIIWLFHFALEFHCLILLFHFVVLCFSWTRTNISPTFSDSSQTHTHTHTHTLP
jgi:hypothetical protein